MGLQGLALAQGRYEDARELLRDGIDGGIAFAHMYYTYAAVAGAPFEEEADAAEQNGDAAAASAVLDGLDETQKADKDIAPVLTAIELAGKAAKQAGAAGELRGRLDANPADHQVRHDLALALYAEGGREAAIEELLEIVRRDRSWNDDAARKQLLDLFEAMGVGDELTVGGRRKLSTILFS